MGLYFKSLRILFTLLLIFQNVYAQDTFRIIGGEQKEVQTFQLINNLIIIPVKVNGSTLKFLLDTGVNKTILFNLSIEDSLKLKNTTHIKIKGLGKGDYLNAIKSDNNSFSIGKISNRKHTIYLISGKKFDLSPQLGVHINGIIGGDLFRDFIVDINYSTKRVKFNNPKTYRYHKCRKCQQLALSFRNKKPYVDLMIQNEESKPIQVKLLIDSGGSDTLWLFASSHEAIRVPKDYFDDYLGKGLGGDIFGKRAKLKQLGVGNYSFHNVNVAYPDSSAIGSLQKHKERSGTLGAGILKRFRVIFDYPHKKITFKRKSKYFNDPFLYNMSGIELAYSGKMLVKERESAKLGDSSNLNGNTIEIIYDYVYAFKNSYQITIIRKGSPANKAGLLPKDIVLQVNGKSAYNYTLEEIIAMLSLEEGERIKLLIDRGGEILKYSFKLEKLLQKK